MLLCDRWDAQTGNTGERDWKWKPSLTHLVFPFLSPVSGNGSAETTLTAAPGDIALLPCYTDGTVTPNVTTWIKNGRELITGGGAEPSPAPSGQRLTVLHDGSLNIRLVVPGDEGSYLCNSTLPGDFTFHARVQLQVTSKWSFKVISPGGLSGVTGGTLIVNKQVPQDNSQASQAVWEESRYLFHAKVLLVKLFFSKSVWGVQLVISSWINWLFCLLEFSVQWHHLCLFWRVKKPHIIKHTLLLSFR